jgi:hypothetical protein
MEEAIAAVEIVVAAAVVGVVAVISTSHSLHLNPLN